MENIGIFKPIIQCIYLPLLINKEKYIEDEKKIWMQYYHVYNKNRE
jgi:hypothetical protein